jgi:hypothetical protein
MTIFGTSGSFPYDYTQNCPKYPSTAIKSHLRPYLALLGHFHMTILETALIIHQPPFQALLVQNLLFVHTLFLIIPEFFFPYFCQKLIKFQKIVTKKFKLRQRVLQKCAKLLYENGSFSQFSRKLLKLEVSKTIQFFLR